jgi:prepilin-type N-terminal cleavage/methylation domain-containing protein
MSSPRRLFHSARSRSGKGGFTLVELLVVIAIIALLAGIAIGPITHAMSVAKDNAGMQTTHSLYIADFQYSIDNSHFADAADSGGIAQAMLQGGYVSDPTLFYLGGNTVKYTGTDAAHGIQNTNVSWDFLGSGAGGSYNGLTTSDPDQLPLVWATGNKIVIPASSGTYGTATINGNGKNYYGSDGIPVAYKSGVSTFQKVSDVTTSTIAKFIDNSYVPPANTTYAVRAGSN